jgi:1,4-dihydroxy-2-naphthoyl-CoA synthase
MFWTACVRLRTWTKAKNAHARFDFQGAFICSFEGGFKSSTYTTIVGNINFMDFNRLLLPKKYVFGKFILFHF